jgi:hypothetical protein
MTTKVIFRKFRNGDVIALFPEVAGSSNPSTCQSYTHVGQHGAADPHLTATYPATAEEYAPLLAELKRIGYDDLEICKRVQASAYRIRRAQL